MRLLALVLLVVLAGERSAVIDDLVNGDDAPAPRRCGPRIEHDPTYGTRSYGACREPEAAPTARPSRGNFHGSRLPRARRAP